MSDLGTPTNMGRSDHSLRAALAGPHRTGQLVSVVVTVKDEAKTILSLLDSLINQTLVPHEILIVDAGSKDQTLEIVKKKAQLSTVPIVVLSKEGNRSMGRNAGISVSKGNIIAVTDAGCIPKKSWLEELIRPFEQSKVAMSAGGYFSRSKSMTSQIMASFMSIQFTHNSTGYLPSSRSIAFKKQAWQEVGGYPEHLDYCEDLIFAQAIKGSGEVAYAPMAQVEWLVSSSYKQFFDKLRHYAQGDVVAGYKPHVLKITSIYLRWALMLVFPILIPLYIAFISIYKSKHQPVINSMVTTCVVQLTADMAVMLGAAEGFAMRVFQTSEAL